MWFYVVQDNKRSKLTVQVFITGSLERQVNRMSLEKHILSKCCIVSF